MTSAELLTDAFDRIRGVVHRAVDGLSADDLAHRIGGDANSIAWLVWHLTRIQDDHVADVAGVPQVWTSGGWVERFGLPLDPADTGYGHDDDQVAAVRVGSGELLTGYHDAVYQRTIDFVAPLADGDLGRVVDRAWDPPVTLGVRLVSVISDDLQHAGQANFIRGLL
ncbi:DUF664 domain-containing protein [Actinomadura viridis]|uniref:Damage-inducible protein DinB n=1 Tax=Actinomadura viridis TaxID=58110 RepID=A0A931GRE8_9ACTN|nr:DUF664 domain-containing protein [Actinomadura viridis]MBG6092766.1 putative damage-inducible protein DinB [Actinomadura viridis]